MLRWGLYKKMTLFVIELNKDIVSFYSQIAEMANLSIEQVLTDVLCKTAGELSIRALNEKKSNIKQ